MDSKDQITNFVLNICLWQTFNKGYFHRMSIHLQDIIPDFVIFSLIVNDGELIFEGHDLKTNEQKSIKASEVDPKHIDEILNVIKNINLFHS